MKAVLFVFVGVFGAASAQTAKNHVIAKTLNLISGFPTIVQTAKVISVRVCYHILRKFGDFITMALVIRSKIEFSLFYAE